MKQVKFNLNEGLGAPKNQVDKMVWVGGNATCVWFCLCTLSTLNNMMTVVEFHSKADETQ